ncbi:hypothetical protein GW17_00025164, partial [Ensete ventricosum]
MQGSGTHLSFSIRSRATASDRVRWISNSLPRPPLTTAFLRAGHAARTEPDDG